MRFIIVSALSYEALCEALNSAVIGNGKVFDVREINGVYKAMIDMNPTHVVTNEDLLYDLEDDESKPKGVVMSA